uniref:Protein 2 n=1 Tax=Linum virus 1 TaxID=2977971 RepID=A0A9N7AB02_9RHAB|nr:TPA_asm: protein 2 [Linum virus 1]
MATIFSDPIKTAKCLELAKKIDQAGISGNDWIQKAESMGLVDEGFFIDESSEEAVFIAEEMEKLRLLRLSNPTPPPETPTPPSSASSQPLQTSSSSQPTPTPAPTSSEIPTGIPITRVNTPSGTPHMMSNVAMHLGVQSVYDAVGSTDPVQLQRIKAAEMTADNWSASYRIPLSDSLRSAMINDLANPDKKFDPNYLGHYVHGWYARGEHTLNDLKDIHESMKTLLTSFIEKGNKMNSACEATAAGLRHASETAVRILQLAAQVVGNVPITASNTSTLSAPLMSHATPASQGLTAILQPPSTAGILQEIIRPPSISSVEDIMATTGRIQSAGPSQLSTVPIEPTLGSSSSTAIPPATQTTSVPIPTAPLVMDITDAVAMSQEIDDWGVLNPEDPQDPKIPRFLSKVNRGYADYDEIGGVEEVKKAIFDFLKMLQKEDFKGSKNQVVTRIRNRFAVFADPYIKK